MSNNDNSVKFEVTKYQASQILSQCIFGNDLGIGISMKCTLTDGNGNEQQISNRDFNPFRSCKLTFGDGNQIEIDPCKFIIRDK